MCTVIPQLQMSLSCLYFYIILFFFLILHIFSKWVRQYTTLINRIR